jgi:mRNA-degrading endonuclease RelE of RelBE toxin-antitoxin system
MAYFVELSKEADRAFNKLDQSIKERIAKKLKDLETNPELGKPIMRSETFNTMIWELRMFSPNVRIYYTIKKCQVMIEEIIYEGKVSVQKIGDKRSQRRDMDGLS